jgi:hypothetical protein
MNTLTNTSTAYTVDAEHGRLRLVVLLLFIVTWVISFAILSVIIESTGLNLLAVLISFVIAYGISTLIERRLKARWPSGRSVLVAAEGVKLVRHGQIEQEMRADQAINPIYWRFAVRKRSRVPKGWLMCACALEHEEKHLTVYTFMSPKDFEAYSRASWFTHLAPKKEAAGKTDLRLAGEQRRLREAENYRWLNGAEMSKEEFERYIEQISTQFPEWAPLH